MAIRLTKIYTRTGDKGLTALVGGKRVPKESARLEAYGTIDELNAIIGIVRTYLPEYRSKFGGDFEAYSESLRRIQNELFDVGSELATPADFSYPQMHKMGAGEVKKLEAEMDAMEKELEPLKSFTLPGGRSAQRVFASGAHGVQARGAGLLAAEARRGHQRSANHLCESAERSSVRAIQVGRQASRRAGIFVGSSAEN
jgi:ATP:cob(I)alamin adenosyltransferase